MSVKIDEDSMSLENNGVETVAAFASTVRPESGVNRRVRFRLHGEATRWQ